MQAWLMVFRKDLRMSRLSLVAFIGLIVVSLLFISLSYTYQSGLEFALAFLTILTGPLMLYFPIHLLLSLRHEWQRSAPVWLHTPISGLNLLLSKMLVGLIYFLASLLVMVIFGAWLVNIGLHRWGTFQNATLTTSLHSALPNLWIILVLGLLGMVAVSLYMGVWAALISVGMQSVKNRLRRFSLLVGVLIILIPTWGFAQLYRIPLFQNLLHLGQVQIPIHYQNTVNQAPKAEVVHVTLYASEMVFYVIVVAVVVYLSGWLLDKKVEV